MVFIADDLGFFGPGSPDLMTELCPPQDTAQMHTKTIEKRRGASPQSTCRGKGNPGPEKPKTVTSKSVTWRCLGFIPRHTIVSEIIAQLIPQTSFCCNFPVHNYRIDSCTKFCCIFYLFHPEQISAIKNAPVSKLQNYFWPKIMAE